MALYMQRPDEVNLSGEEGEALRQRLAEYAVTADDCQCWGTCWSGECPKSGNDGVTQRFSSIRETAWPIEQTRYLRVHSSNKEATVAAACIRRVGMASAPPSPPVLSAAYQRFLWIGDSMQEPTGELLISYAKLGLLRRFLFSIAEPGLWYIGIF